MSQRDLRNPSAKADLFASSGICSLTWQGDFGKGINTGSGVWSDPGANPCVLYGPVPTPGFTGNGAPMPNWKLGMTVNGEAGTEFIFCKLVLGALTDLLPGQAYWWDERFNATLMSGTNANNPINAEMGVLNVFSVQQAAGTYYAWIQRAGHCAVLAAAGSVANGQAETSATAGTLKFTTNTGHTAGFKSAQPSSSFGASSSITFTANSVNGSPYLTAVASTGALGGIEDLQVGMTITGAGLPANACIAAIDKLGSVWRITIGTAVAASYNVAQNATATANGVTFTVTSHVAANMFWATLAVQN